MSLQVWLPLDGDLRNQGLSNIYPINDTGFTIDDSGKIGKCYLTNKKRLDFNISDLSSSSWSLATWFYPTTSSSSAHQYIISLNTSTASDFTGTLCLYADKLCARIGGTTYQGNAVDLNIWHHGVVTYDYINKILKIYHNGNLVLTKNNPVTPVAATKAFIGVRGGGTTAPFEGKLNDVRIYDHCLSAKEIKELAKGLILHYRLSKPMPNLLENGAFTSLTTGNTGLGTGIYATSWGGYNSGISNPTTNYHACIDQDTFGYPVYMYNETNGSRNWKGISQSISKNLIEGSTDYIFSCDIYQTLSGGKIFGGFYYKKTGATSSSFASGQYTISASMIPKGSWTKVSIKVPFNDNIDSSVSSVTFYIYGYGFSDNGIVYIKNVKLEKGTRATAFIPNESDTLYSAMGYDSNIELDCAQAGNQNDGTIVGTITATADSPRYETSYYFNGTSYFKTTSPFGEIKTISLWVKWDSIPSGQSVIFVDYKSYFGLGLYSGGILCGSRSSVKAFSKTNLIANTWYHFVIVAPNGGSNAERELYINGQEQTALTATSNWSYSIDELQVGKRSFTNDGFKGKISDFRVYCTALSAEDIKELYNTAAQIDKNGNVYTYEFKE